VFHLEGPMEGGGMRIVDVWESPEAFQTFGQERLAAAFQKAGVLKVKHFCRRRSSNLPVIVSRLRW
jgi:hypothetical protein